MLEWKAFVSEFWWGINHSKRNIRPLKKKEVIIIASSCEDLAKIFYKLNYAVYAICKYNSLKLNTFCSEIITADFSDIKKIKNFIDKKDPNKKIEILIGAGFSESLEKDLFSSRKFYLGNNYSIHKKVNSKKFFFDLKKDKINIPICSYIAPKSKDWLIKKFSSFGGNDVRLFKARSSIKSSEYFQKIIDGENLSIQFIADEKKIKVLSICNQIFKKVGLKPYIIKGIITKKVNSTILGEIKEICTKIKKIYKLKGINNLDIIIQKKHIKFSL